MNESMYSSSGTPSYSRSSKSSWPLPFTSVACPAGILAAKGTALTE